MRHSQLACILVLAAFAPLTLNAQQSPGRAPASAAAAPSQDPQAVAVLRRSLAALGAPGVATIQDTVIHATTTPAPNSGGEPGTLTITTKGARLIRFDGSGGAKNSSTIYNAGREMRSSDKGWLAAPAANAHHKRIEHLPALMLAYEIARGDLSATYVGEETIATQSVHHIRVARVSQLGNAIDATTTGVTELDVYVDAQTFLITKIAYPLASEIDWRITFPVEIYYDQYQTINGIAVPHHQRYFFNGQPIHELQITSVAINQGTPDSLFEAK
jgi:hypothetical protein